MSTKDRYRNRIELLQGTLDMLILQTLQWGPQHGYGIVQALTFHADIRVASKGRSRSVGRRAGSAGAIQRS